MTDSSANDRRLPWLRVLLEGLVIVGSILLAFGIEAWWQGLGEQEEEQDALEVLQRDLTSAVTQLGELAELAQAGADAALDAYMALGGDLASIDRAVVSDRLIRSLSRRTMQLPRAGYTDLLSTGTLGLIDDRDLRDAIVQFHEEAERIETIYEKNSVLYLDGHLRGLLVGDGLIVQRPVDAGARTQLQRDSIVRATLGDFEHPSDPLWDLPADAREWGRLRSALFAVARSNTLQVLNLTRLGEQAAGLLVRIQTRLDQ